VVSALDRKLLRDLWGMKAQGASIAVVVACGVGVLIGSVATIRTLRTSRDEYYERYRFAHVFARLKRAPEAVAAALRELPGVAQLETRVVEDVAVDVPGLREPATLRLVSIPESGQPGLNRLHLRRGRWPAPGRLDEVLLNEAFADANHLRPGDRLSAVVNGRHQALRVVGVALSPEYVYQLQEGASFPDNERFGVGWVPREGLAAAFDLTGAFDDVVVGLAPGASWEPVIAGMDRLLDRYGSLGAFGRDRQMSHKLVTDEFAQVGTMSVILPAIFLGVAAFLLNVVLSRHVATEREQIAALKGIGYGNGRIGLHYVKLVVVVVLVGIALGVTLGALYLRLLVHQYSHYFHFPAFLSRVDPDLILFSGGLSLAAALVGALTSVRQATLLPPAEAMRPPSPPVYRKTLLDRLGLGHLLHTTGQLVVRNVERRPVRTALSALAIGFAVSIVVVMNLMFGGIAFLTDSALPATRREDVGLTFTTTLSRPEALSALRALPGVVQAEAVRAVPVRLRSGPRHEEASLTGLVRDGELRRVLDQRLRPVDAPDRGLLLSAALADRLGVRPGDRVQVEVLVGDRRRLELEVTAVVAEHLGYGAYLDSDALGRLLGEASAVDVAYLRVDPARAEALFQTLKGLPRTTGAAMAQTVLRNFRDLVRQSMLTNLSLLFLFAGSLAMAIVYNDARIALAERARELATLRVIGFTRTEIARILFGELALVMVAGAPLGCLIGWGVAEAIIPVFGNEMMRMPVVLSASSFLTAIGMIFFAGILSGLVVRRRLDRLDLIAVLKTRE